MRANYNIQKKKRSKLLNSISKNFRTLISKISDSKVPKALKYLLLKPQKHNRNTIKGIVKIDLPEVRPSDKMLWRAKQQVLCPVQQRNLKFQYVTSHNVRVLPMRKSNNSFLHPPSVTQLVAQPKHAEETSNRPRLHQIMPVLR